jgi:hypothetical protein
MSEITHDNKTTLKGLQKKRVDYQIQSIKALYALD